MYEKLEEHWFGWMLLVNLDNTQPKMQLWVFFFVSNYLINEQTNIVNFKAHEWDILVLSISVTRDYSGHISAVVTKAWKCHFGHHFVRNFVRDYL